MSILLAVGLVIVAGGLGIFWGQRVRARWLEANRLSASGHGEHVESNEQVQDAWVAFVRAGALGLLTMGSVIYLLGSVASSAAGEIRGLGEGVQLFSSVKESATGGNIMDALAPTILRILVSCSSFLVVFGLSWAFLPGVFPYPKDSKRSAFLSLSTSLLISATFALWIGTSSAASDVLLTKITSGFLSVTTTFFSILVGAIGLYLVWKQIQRFLKPKA